MKSNNKIIHVLILMSVLFLSLIVYLTYFQIFNGPKLADSGANPRSTLENNEVIRGTIFDRDGEILAYNETNSDNTETRVYPFNDLYCHVIGYSNSKYGSSMLESQYNGQLTGKDFLNSIMGLGSLMSGEKRRGSDISLTISHKLQQKASNLLGNRKGAVIALNPKTGEILTLVSKPGFNPNAWSMEQNWEDISQSDENKLLSRATSGLYPPGSTFKTIIAAAAVEEMMDGEIYTDTGTIEIDGKSFKNYGDKIYGELDIKKAFAVSSNCAFINLADKLGAEIIKSKANDFGFNKEIDFDLPLAKSSVLNSDITRTHVAAVGMGQGQTLATPFQMALVASCVANNGTLMQPYVVKDAKYDNGLITYKARENVFTRCISPYTAQKVGEMMKECVLSGTGTGAAVNGIEVAGKTGTAENGTDKDHAWFICYADDGNEKIAICVMIEYSGMTGSDACVPIARELIKLYYGR